VGSSRSTIYCADTSGLIGFAQQYPAANFPALWDDLADLARQGRLIACEMVRDDCKREECKRNPEVMKLLRVPGIVKGFSADQERALKHLQANLQRMGKVLTDYESGSSASDEFVIAQAMSVNLTVEGSFASGCCVVLQTETPKGNAAAAQRWRIPNVCSVYGIGCVTPVQVIVEEGWVFDRAATPQPSLFRPSSRIAVTLMGDSRTATPDLRGISGSRV